MHPVRFSPRATKQRFVYVYTLRSCAADDKEKCCLESRSWLYLGHPDDGACTFSTILLFLPSVLSRIRVPCHLIEQHISLSLLATSSSFGFCLSPLALFIFLPFSSVSQHASPLLFDRSSLLLSCCLFFPHPARFKDRVPEDDQMRIGEKKSGNARIAVP